MRRERVSIRDVSRREATDRGVPGMWSGRRQGRRKKSRGRKRWGQEPWGV